MVWGAIAYNSRSPLVLIRSTTTAQRHVPNILQSHMLPLMQRLPGAIFQQYNARPHTARVSRDCLRIGTALPWPVRSPDLSLIDPFGWRVGHPTSLNELEAREIGSRVGRNQTTVMWICDLWMQEGTTDRRGRSHPPQCTTSLSARTIQHRLQQSGLSARHPLLGLPLTQNHRRLRRQWCDERRIWAAEWNEVVFTDELRICLQHYDGRIRV
ncbi:transposable element Tcb1 transposase [Trichonephila clavipes]|nr:transposable element Tcb1 transposase [Trichonephila clavipes]